MLITSPKSQEIARLGWVITKTFPGASFARVYPLRAAIEL